MHFGTRPPDILSNALTFGEKEITRSCSATTTWSKENVTAVGLTRLAALAIQALTQNQDQPEIHTIKGLKVLVHMYTHVPQL